MIDLQHRIGLPLALASLLLLAACSENPPQEFKTTANLDDAGLSTLLTGIGEAAGGGFDAEAMVKLARATKLDTEEQMKLRFDFNGAETTLLYHTWREQEDEIHVYFASPSEALIKRVDMIAAPLVAEEDS